MSVSFEQACALVMAPGSLLEITDGEVGGVPMKVFAGAPPSLRTIFDLAAMRDDEFMIYEDERWTMPQILKLAGQIGHLLVDGHGVTKGDRVAIAMRNYPEWVASFAAIVSIGAVAVPLNAWWEAEEFHFALDDSGAGVALVDDERLERLARTEPGAIRSAIIVARSQASDDEFTALAGHLAPQATKLENQLTADATMPVAEIEATDNATILYTSGTTGHPKGALSTHQAVISALMSFMARAMVGQVQDGIDPTAQTDAPPRVFMLPVPLFHVTGLVPVMLGSFVSGARLVMTHRWNPDRALELIERERVTNFVGVPTMSWDLLEAATFDERDTSSLESVGGGGAPMPAELVRRIEANFSQGRPGLGYGMTETNAYGPQITGDEFVANPTSTGRPIPVMEVRVTDTDGTPLPAGEVGEIWFKGPMIIKGYWNRPEATTETIVDGWLRTGDIGRVDETGLVYVSDRAKDMVLRGGENIYCAEVEAAIYEHAAVYEAAVYGIPHDRLGEDLACHIMVKPGMTISEADLQSFLDGRLAKFKIPGQITVVTEPLPRNASGKILKRTLRDLVSP